MEFGIRNLDFKWCWHALCLAFGLDSPLKMGEWVLSRLLQDYCWVKSFVQLILGMKVTESKVECHISLSFHIPAASAEDEWFTFFIVNVFFLFFFYHSSRKCQVANATPRNYPCALHRKLGGWWKGMEAPEIAWREWKQMKQMEKQLCKDKVTSFVCTHTWQSCR